MSIALSPTSLKRLYRLLDIYSLEKIPSEYFYSLSAYRHEISTYLDDKCINITTIRPPAARVWGPSAVMYSLVSQCSHAS